ncbi:MAG: hypothetical protein ABIP41_07165 [Croceibacterium sp.]
MIGHARWLLGGSALCALAIALPGAAAAQSFQGVPSVVTGGAAISTAPGFTQVDVTAPETVINWLASDISPVGTFDFQPAGTSALFNNATNGPEFTVLNRVFPVDAASKATGSTISLNGTITSRNGGIPGSNVWFYSPTGIIVGPTARVTVGGFLLTTDDIQFVPNIAGGVFLPGSIYLPGNLVSFRGPNDPAGFVTVQAGAQVNAVGANGYVALVAPRVTQAGQVLAERSVAYIAAEELDLRINAGLFDIAIVTGTDDPNGVVHTGTTGGAASTGLADQQRISMVALPKNTALTMLLRGSIGYAPAAVAANEGSAVVLSAGYATDVPSAVPAVRLGSIDIGNSVFSNPLQGFASDTITVAPSKGNTDFRATTALYGLNAVRVTAAGGAQVFGTDLSLFAGLPGAGGTIDVLATTAGKISITNSLLANAGSNASPFGFAVSLDGTGGAIGITADGGDISVPALTATAAAAGRFDDVLGGTGTGGTVTLRVLNGGTLNAATLNLDANGTGGGSSLQGGRGVAGTVSASLADGAFSLGTVRLAAVGTGGAGGAAGGEGTGGTASFALADVTGPSGARTVSSLTLDASGTGGSGGGGTLALADAGAVKLTAGPLNPASALTFTGDLTLTSSGTRAAAGNGATIAVSGAPLTVGGNIAVTTSRDAAITAAQPLTAGGTVSIIARTLTETGMLASGGAMTIDAAGGISADRLSSGGTTLLQAVNGPLAVADLRSVGAVTALARSIDIGSSGALSFANLAASAGNATVTTAGNLSLAQGSASGALTLASTGGAVTGSGPLTAGGAASVSGATGVNLPSLASGGTTLLSSSGGSVSVASLTSADAVTAQGNAVTIASPGALTFADLLARAGNANVNTGGNLAVNQGSASGTLTLTSSGGSVTGTGPLTSGGAASISGATGIALASLSSGGTGTTLISSVGPVTVGALTSAGAVIARGNSVTIASPASLVFADLVARAGAANVTTAGALTLLQAAASGDLIARAGTALTVSGPVTGANVSLTGTGSLTVNANVTAANVLTLASGGLFSANAVLLGRSITATSADIALGAAARLGALGITNDLSLINGDAAADTRIGIGNSYGLTPTEVNQLYADRLISITAGPQPFIIDSFAFDLTHLGAAGTLRLLAPAAMNVTGTAQFVNAGAGQTVSLQGGALTVITDAGSLDVASAGGARGATLQLTGNSVTVASAAAIGAIAGLASLDAITARLDLPDVQRASLVQAGTIAVSATSAFYVQNSGPSLALAERQGFTANALSIVTGSAATRIAINGRIATAGGFATGLLAVPLVTINGAPAAAGGRFDPRSTINGCVIGSNCTNGTFGPATSLELVRPVPTASSGLVVGQLIELTPREPRGDLPLIDEPITGVGNDDLWQPTCTKDRREGRCRAPGKE